MIRREGHDPQHYTISRRGKKMSSSPTYPNSTSSVTSGAYNSRTKSSSASSWSSEAALQTAEKVINSDHDSNHRLLLDQDYDDRGKLKLLN